MNYRSSAQAQRRSRRACRLGVERCEERTLLSSGLDALTAAGLPATVPLKAATDPTLTTLASFNGANGANPWAGLVRDPRGNLFGTTQLGGANNLGTVFELVAHSGTITTLASFNGANGARPSTVLVRGPRGHLFGTTFVGGANNLGTIFKL